MPEEQGMEGKYIIGSEMECSLDQLVSSSHQVRRNFDPDKLKELAQNILQNGQLQAILVRIISFPSEEEEVAQYEIIVGERRYHPWEFGQLSWPSLGREKPDLLFFHPPEYAAYATRPGEVPPTWDKYVQFLTDFLLLAYQESKLGSTLAFLITDQHPPQTSISSPPFLLHHATQWVQDKGWKIEQILDCPLPFPKITDQYRNQLWESRLIQSLRRSLIIAKK